MRLFVVKGNTGLRTAFGQHRLPVGQTGQGGGVKVRKGVKGIALDGAAFDSGVQEARIEMGVVAHQDGPLAALFLDLAAHQAKDLGERQVFRLRGPKRVVGIDAGEIQRRLFDVGTVKRRHIEAVDGMKPQLATVIHAHKSRGNLQNGVGGRAKAARLQIHDYRQKTAEALLDHRGAARAAASVSTTCQRSTSPARRGTSSPSARGRVAGTSVSARRRVTVSSLIGNP